MNILDLSQTRCLESVFADLPKVFSSSTNNPAIARTSTSGASCQAIFGRSSAAANTCRLWCEEVFSAELQNQLGWPTCACDLHEVPSYLCTFRPFNHNTPFLVY